MIFSELYSAYYNAVAEILRRAMGGDLTEKEMRQVVSKTAFSESAMTVLPSLRDQKWQLLDGKRETPLRHAPTMPLTTVEKQWLKAISLDPRIKLFGIRFDGLEDVEPLFAPEDFRVYDRYSDGDPYEDPQYIERFQLILTAIRHGYPLRVDMRNRRGNNISMRVIPHKLEYSEKDDKFRLITGGCRHGGTINLGRMTACRRDYDRDVTDEPPRKPIMHTVTIAVTDERNALERVMLHFAHFEKRAERIDSTHYRLTVQYDRDDETEMVIRILSFGPLVRVEEPQTFVELIRDRLRRQKACGLK